MNRTYVVKAGDTLFGISNQFGVSVTELASLNNIKGDTLIIGQELIIPAKSGTNPNNMFMYTVKSGDTLYSIAQKYGTTVDKIIDLNYLKNNNLTVGQELRIPETYTKEDEMMLPNYTNYVVKKGDTLYSIANANNINVDILIKDNALTSNNLTIGQVLKIRTYESEVVEECFGPDYEIPTSAFVPTITYTVQKGDNLYNIASRYNTSVSTIQNLNNLNGTNLTIGQQLKIPTTSNLSGSVGSSPQVYIVKSGDSLYSIAKKFNTTVDILKNINNLTSNNLSIGQQLKIPSTSGNSSSSTQTYIVKSGDNLYSIARKFNTTVDTIKKKNNLTSNLLSIGQKLII